MSTLTQPEKTKRGRMIKEKLTASSTKGPHTLGAAEATASESMENSLYMVSSVGWIKVAKNSMAQTLTKLTIDR